jgi:hypothetical protein
VTMGAPLEHHAPEYDRAAAATVIGRVLALPGGADLVTSSFAQIPGAVVTQTRSGMFGPRVSSVQLGAWRYTPAPACRVTVAHVVGNVVLSEDELPPAAAAQHLTAAVSQHIADFGNYIIPDVLSLLEGLSVASG